MSYNGWTNYETWNAALWMGEGSAEYWAEQAQECFDDAEACDTFSRAENAAFALAERMEADSDERTEELAGVTGMYADLLNAALSQINWHEIARHYIDDCDQTVSDEDQCDDDDQPAQVPA